MVRLLAISLVGVACGRDIIDNLDDFALQAFIDLARDHPDAAIEEIKGLQFPIVQEVGMPMHLGLGAGNGLPTVVGHGMGDSCFNSGMQSITNGVSNKTGTYAVCIPTGKTQISDTINGFLKNMDASIDDWAEQIRADPNLANGFNCLGFSQGNSQCRGYIQRYNDPPVQSWISVHGTHMGVQALPGCFKQEKRLSILCKTIVTTLGKLAYNPKVQGLLYQAGYFRDATKVTSSAYLANSQIAGWNNESPDRFNATLKENFLKTTTFAMVKAGADSMVYPNECEQWGDIEGRKISAMRDTNMYKNDLFGLKTADEAGSIFFEETSGDHLQFTDTELYGWVEKYFMSGEVTV